MPCPTAAWACQNRCGCPPSECRINCNRSAAVSSVTMISCTTVRVDRLAQRHWTMRTLPHGGKLFPKMQNGRPFVIRQGPLLLGQRGQGCPHRLYLCELRIPAFTQVPPPPDDPEDPPRYIGQRRELGFILELRQLVLQGLALRV